MKKYGVLLRIILKKINFLDNNSYHLNTENKDILLKLINLFEKNEVMKINFLGCCPK